MADFGLDKVFMLEPDTETAETMKELFAGTLKIYVFEDVESFLQSEFLGAKIVVVTLMPEDMRGFVSSIAYAREVFGFPLIMSAKREDLLKLPKMIVPAFEGVVVKPPKIPGARDAIVNAIAAEEVLSMTDESTDPKNPPIVELSFENLRDISSEFPKTVIIPVDNYYVVNDYRKIETLPAPTLNKNRPAKFDARIMERINKARNKNYGGIVDSNRQPVDSIKFKRDKYFFSYLVKQFSQTFVTLKANASNHSVIDKLLNNFEEELVSMVDETMERCMKEHPVVEHFYMLKQKNSDSAFKAISRHIISTAYTAGLFTASYFQDKYESLPASDFVKTVCLASLLKEHGAEKLFTAYTVGSMEFIKLWSERVPKTWDSLKSHKSLNKVRFIVRSQLTNTVGLPVFRYALLTRIMQIASALDVLINGYGVIKIGQYCEGFYEGTSMLNACHHLIVHSRKPRHMKDYPQVFDPKLIEYLFNILGLQDALNYQKLIEDVRNNRCGRVIISPNEIQPVTAVCPYTEAGHRHDCAGCSIRVNSEYRGSQFRTCEPAHKEITKINSDFYEKRTPDSVEANRTDMKNKKQD